MTFTEMYNLGSTLLDKSGTAYFSESMSDDFMNVATNIVMTNEIDLFEKTNVLSTKILPLKKTFTFSNKSSLNPTTDIPNYWYLIGVLADVNITCNGVSNPSKLEVKPLPLSASNTIWNDPFNKPNNINAFYEEVDNKIQFITSFSSLSGTGTYLKTPNKIDAANNGSTICEFNDAVCREIVMQGVVGMLSSIGEYEAAKVMELELQQIRGKNG